MPNKDAPKYRSLKGKRLVGSAIVHAILIFFAVAFLFPLAWMVLTSLKPLDETMKIPPSWIPSEILWSNYREATSPETGIPCTKGPSYQQC